MDHAEKQSDGKRPPRFHGSFFRDVVVQKDIDRAVQERIKANAVTDEGDYFRICDDVRALYIPKTKPHWWSLSWDDGRWDYYDALKARFEGSADG